MTSTPQNAEPYCQFPIWLMSRTDVSDGAKVLWAYLRDCERRYGEGNAREGRERIAQAIGTNVDGYKRRSAELQRLGLLRVDTKAGAYGTNVFVTVEQRTPINPTPKGRGENAPTRSENTPTRSESAPKVGAKTHRRSVQKRTVIQKNNQKINQTSVEATESKPEKPNAGAVRAAIERGFKATTGQSIKSPINPSRAQLDAVLADAERERPDAPLDALEALGAELGKRRAYDPWRLLLSPSGGFGLMPVDVPVVADPVADPVTDPELDRLQREHDAIDLDAIHDRTEKSAARTKKDSLKTAINARKDALRAQGKAA